MDKIKYISVSAALFVAVWMFWWLAYPQMLSYQEQYQLFLFTADYLNERILTVGGVADYISEFFVQLYYVPILGAAMVALALTMLQVLLGAYCTASCKVNGTKLPLYILSALPSVTLLYFMGNENVLLSFPVALVLTLAATLAMRLMLSCPLQLYLSVVAIGYVILYWAVGPAAILYPLLSVVQNDRIRLKWLWIAIFIGLGYGVVMVFGATVCRQYPYSQLMMGINYYRVSNMHPIWLFVVAASIIIIPFLRFILNKLPTAVSYAAVSALLLICIVMVPSGYDDDKMEVFKFDSLVRNGEWHKVIAEAHRRPPSNDFCLQALNLALAKTGQLTDRMFEFPQTDINGLIAKRELDNTTCLIAAEALYHLGMVNSAFRYNFDTQEAIMNDRKSGRFMKRMAECMLINGNYKVASKYIDMLKHTLFYSDWANVAEKYLNDEEAIDRHPDWGEKRRIRFRQELFYDYAEIEKLLGLLAIESGGQNLLAWDYFNAALMLKGDLPTLCGMYHYATETFHLSEMPRHIQEAIALYWTFGHADFEGIPFCISDNVKARIASLARVYGQNQNNPAAWAPKYRDTFWIYFLQRRGQKDHNTTNSHKGSMRED